MPARSEALGAIGEGGVPVAGAVSCGSATGEAGAVTGFITFDG
jgi:hypothetical protein